MRERPVECGRFWVLAAVIACGLPSLAYTQDKKAIEAKAAEEAVEEQPVNPAQQIAPLFRNLMRGLGLQPNGDDQGDMDDPRGGRGKDPVDSRIPRDPQIDEIWRASRDAVQKQDWKRTIELTQRLLDFPEDAVLEQQPGQWQSVRLQANRLLGELPATARADYERRFGGLARQLLNQQQTQPDLPKLVDIATRYFYTDAGAEAAARLARSHFDQHEFLLASQWNRELWVRGWSGTQNPRWLLQAAFAARQAGLDLFETALADLLKAEPPQPMLLGGRRITPREWWDSTVVSTPGLPIPEIWQEFGGTAARLATASEGDPLLLPEWSQPLSSVPSVRERINALVRDLRDDGIPAIPAASPVVIGDKLAFRDLRSVRVVDLKSGRTLWQTQEGVSPERILNGLPADGMNRNNAWMMRRNMQPFGRDFDAQSADMHPLASWLYRDGTNGFLSADRERLYVLEDLAVMTRNQVGFRGNNDTEALDQFGVTWSSNRLSAYDISSGRLVWTAGGPATTEAVGLPLAGSFFLGVPTIDHDELYVVTSTGQEIRLQALDPATGRPRWSQLLAYSDTKIELDVARRWLGAPVAVRDGVIVCPTTVGWVVAVDRTRRSLLWGHRYWPREERNDFDPAGQFLPPRNLTDAWAAGAPIIVGRDVLFAPPDANKLQCLSLIDGQARWSRDRDNGLYIQVVNPDLVLLVGSSRVTAIRISTGENQWELEWEAGDYPSGRGCLFGGRFAVPLNSGLVWVLDVEQGAIAEQLRVFDQHPPLGNLLKVGGHFLSIGPEGCRVFSEKERFLQELAAGKNEPSVDWLTELRIAEYELLMDQTTAALERLRKSPETEWPAELRERRRQGLWSGLVHRARQGSLDEAAEALDELASLSRHSSERSAVDALQILHLKRSGELQSMFHMLVEIAQRPGAGELIARDDNSDVQVQRNVWISGQLQRLWDQNDPEVRQVMTDEVGVLLHAAIESSSHAEAIADGLRLQPWIRFHPDACRLSWRLSDAYADEADFVRAEAELQAWSQHPDRAIAVEAQLRMARLWHKFGLTADATALVERVRKTADDQLLASGQTVSEAVQAWQLTSPEPEVEDAAVSALAAVWPHQPLAIERTYATYMPQQFELQLPEDSEYLRGFAIQYESQEQRLTFRSQTSGEWDWLAPLRSLSRNNHTNYVAHQFLGQSIVLLHRGVLQRISPVRQQIAWATSISEDRDVSDMPHRPPPPNMVDVSSLDTDTLYWTFREQHRGRLVGSSELGICVVGRRSLSVYDPVSGQLRWTVNNLPSDAAIIDCHRVILVVDSVGNQTPYDVFDGSRMELPAEAPSVMQSLAVVGDNLVVVDRKPGIRLFNVNTGGVALRCVNLLTGAEVWKHQVPANSSLARLDDRTLLLLGPAARGTNSKRTLSELDLQTGALKNYDDSPSFSQEEGIVPLRDLERLYLVVNHGRSAGHHYGDGMASTRVHGTLLAWDRDSGRQLWQRRVSNQNLTLERLDQAPFLVFLSRSWKQVNNQAFYTTLHVMAMSKQTGEILLDTKSPSVYSGFHGMRAMVAEHAVELLTYNQKLRIVPAKP